MGLQPDVTPNSSNPAPDEAKPRARASNKSPIVTRRRALCDGVPSSRGFVGRCKGQGRERHYRRGCPRQESGEYAQATGRIVKLINPNLE